MGLNVELLEQSFKLVAPKADALVERFYERLFQKYPAVKPLFKQASMADQKKKLLASLVLVIQNLRKPDKLTEALQAMGARHVDYGTLPAHYDAVGENLLAVLAEFAGPAWTPAVKQAWTEAYSAIKTIMLQGATRRAGATSRAPSAAQGSSRTSTPPFILRHSMNSLWAKLNLSLKTLAVTIPVILIGMSSLTYWLSTGMHEDLQTRLQERSTIIQKQIEVTRGYLASQYVAKIKGAGQGVMKVGQEHSAPDTVPLPATATREISEELSQLGFYSARVISKAPLNPANAPQGAFEEEGLRTLESGAEESVRIESVKGVMTFRRMTPDIIKNQACIGCHTDKKMGDMVGAISVQVPIDKALANLDHKTSVLYGVLGLGATLLAAILFMLLRSLVGSPLKQLGDTVQQIAQGHYDARASVTTQDEVGQLGQSINEMGSTLQAQVTKEREQSAEMQGVTNAISKAQAVIEFNLDGTVITANDNFLNTLGYSLAEIQGQHHRLFCDPTYTNSAEYAGFWAKLNRGEFEAGSYLRIGKGGKEVWINASYNPILNADGKPYKVIKFATDVTEAKKKEIVKYAMDSANNPVLMVDRNLVITYANKAATEKLRALDSEVRKIYPAFNADKLLGTCIDSFHRNPSTQRRILADPKNMPYKAQIQLGTLTMDLTISAIISEKGAHLGNTLEWADITGQKKAQTEVDRLITAASAGQLGERINAEEFAGFFKTLSQGINSMLDAVVAPLHEAQTVLTALAQGDLRSQMTGVYEGEFEQMKTSLNGAVTNLTATLATVRTAAESVSNGAEEITKGNEDLSQRTSEQASSLEETSSAMEEMTSAVKQNADNAKQANQLAIAARDVAEKGGAVTTKAIDAMGEINKSSKKIGDIITVIDEIAFQTNLLALNAAVEAARAGEHGRGFAVVAAEVRNLAQRSATAAKEIKGLINESIQRVTDGSELVDQSGKTLTEIVGSVKRVTDIIAEITASSQEQASGIDQVNKAIMQMDETTQQNAALVEEATSASQSMKEQARELMTQVAAFKLNGTELESQARPRAAARPSVIAADPMKQPLSKKAAASSKAVPRAEPTAIAASNGKDRRQKDEFEEF